MRRSATTLESEVLPDELACLVGLLRRAQLAGPHLEIGTAAGGTLKELMLCYADAARPRFVVVDPFTYFPNQRQIVETNLRQSGLDPAQVDFRESLSDAALDSAVANGDRFSFMFIDASHEAGHVIADLRWTQLLEVGGYVCLHDYAPQHGGVIWAVDRFLDRNQGFDRFTLVESLLVLRKTEEMAGPGVGRLDIAIGHVRAMLRRWRNSIRKRIARRWGRAVRDRLGSGGETRQR